jgi:phospholipid/cholesterol/gamma-HCH transport system substrate-binding protein
MDERVIQFRVGVMVLGTLITTAILVLLFGELPAMVRGNYTVYMHFPEARGVSADTPVRKSGILIGRVTNVEFADGGGVLVTARIRSDVTLHRNEIARVSSSLLGGDGEIQMVPARDSKLPSDPIKEGDLIVGQGPPADPIQVVGRIEGDLTQAISSIGRTSDQIGQLAGQVNELLRGNGEQFSRIVNKVEKTLDGLQLAVANVNELLAEPEETPPAATQQGPTPDQQPDATRPIQPQASQPPRPGQPADTVIIEPPPGTLTSRERGELRRAMRELPLVLQDARQAVQSIQRAAELAQKNLENLEGFTAPLSKQGDELFRNINQSARKLDTVLDDISGFTRNLNSSQGSFSRFVNDPELYQRLNAVACNLQELTRDLRPVVKDARVFADKIARHPEQIGVRGAIERSSGVK